MSRNTVAPVSNGDGLIVLTVAIVSFVGACWIGSTILGLTVPVTAILAGVTFTVCTGVAMRLTNRWAWHRQAMRHAAAVNASRAAARR
jgi:hypothetical protein